MCIPFIVHLLIWLNYGDAIPVFQDLLTQKEVKGPVKEIIEYLYNYQSTINPTKPASITKYCFDTSGNLLTTESKTNDAGFYTKRTYTYNNNCLVKTLSYNSNIDSPSTCLFAFDSSSNSYLIKYYNRAGDIFKNISYQMKKNTPGLLKVYVNYPNENVKNFHDEYTFDTNKHTINMMRKYYTGQIQKISYKVDTLKREVTEYVYRLNEDDLSHTIIYGFNEDNDLISKIKYSGSSVIEYKTKFLYSGYDKYSNYRRLHISSSSTDSTIIQRSIEYYN